MARRNDGEIQHDALDELTWDAAVNARNLAVTVIAGAVTITGEVTSYAERREAERLTEMIPGVRDVFVKLEVVPDRWYGDIELGAAICNALAWAAYLTEHAVQTSVKDGWVTLSGSVQFGFQRQSAEDAVRYMKGVKGVTNSIVVANPDAPAADIKTSIEAALRRRYDSKDQHIVVTTDGRAVTLAGTVTDWWSRYLARRSAWNTPGVEQVHDHLRIAD